MQYKKFKSKYLIYPTLLTIFLYLYLYTFEFMPTSSRILEDTEDSYKRTYLVDSPNCRIPDMKPFDPSVAHLIRKEEPLTCSKEKPLSLTESDQNTLWIKHELFDVYGIHNINLFYCCYTPFERNTDNSNSFRNNCIKFKGTVMIDDEFIRVECFYNNSNIHTDFHAFIVDKNLTTHKHSNTEDRMSILILGLDAVSRLNFHRQLPRTIELLNSLNAIEMLGYNKVGDNTFPNLVPALSGYSVDEIKKSCWRDDKNYFDDCPWIWKNYSNMGFYTCFAEDASNMNTFNYLKRGFLQQPTDYYLRPFIKEYEDTLGYKKLLNAKLCVGSKSAQQILIDYTEKFVYAMEIKKQKFFSLIWGTSLTHDSLNVVPDCDELYYKLINGFREKSLLNNIFLIVLSDHGIRWGDILDTLQGRLEGRLPLLFFIPPKGFYKKFPLAVQNLKSNVKRLITPYDLHETITHLLSSDKLTDKNIYKQCQSYKKQRGISLFYPVPNDRSCNDAGIDETWCTCYQSKELPKNNSFAIELADAVVKHINNITSQYVECAILRLQKIVSIRLEVTNNKDLIFKTEAFRHYTVIVITEPGLGEFEARVRYFLQDNSTVIPGYVSRLNLYGKQSQCVSDYILKLYCFCL